MTGRGQRLATKWASAALARSRPLHLSAVRLEEAPRKPAIGSIAQLRKLIPGTSMIKAREALTATWPAGAASEDVQAAVAWLESDRRASGAKKAEKVADREAKEGAVGVCVLSDGAPNYSGEAKAPSEFTPLAQAGLVELNCETDFVARNELFGQLLADLAHTAALFPTIADIPRTTTEQGAAPRLFDISAEEFLEFPLIASSPNAAAAESSANASAGSTASTAATPPKTVKSAIVDVIARVGERIHLARASTLVSPPPPSPFAPRRSSPESPSPAWFVASAFTHGAAASVSSSSSGTGELRPGYTLSSGKVASILVTRFDRSDETNRTDEASLRSMRGMARSLARQCAGMPTEAIRGQDETALYAQPFLMRLKAAELEGESGSEGGMGGASAEPTSVEASLKSWADVWARGQAVRGEESAVQVLDLRRWGLGEVEEQP